MSAETEFRAVLLAYAPLFSLVKTQIAQNAAEPSWMSPYIVFTSDRELGFTLNNEPTSTLVKFTVHCWAKSASAADDVADAAQTALFQAGALTVGRSTGAEPEMRINGTFLDVEWWDV
jgi:hypothetical protein